MPREAKVTLDLWHEFSADQLQFQASELAASLDRRDELEMAEKVRREQFKTEMEEISGHIRRVTIGIRLRGEMRATPCTVIFHKPNVGAKTTIREDTGEVVKEEAMTPAECQEHLFPPELEQAKSVEVGK
jgi:hypothetical protein